jgi:hypothetical protein
MLQLRSRKTDGIQRDWPVVSQCYGERAVSSNETELSYRWRERAWIGMEVFSNLIARRQSGQRLTAAIG